VGEWRYQIEAAQTGDVDAFGAVVREFQDMAVGYAFSILGSFELAEDAAQEAFIQAYRDLKTLQKPRAFPAWLRRLVFKHCDRQTRRKQLETVPLDAVPQAASVTPNPMQATVHKELRQRVLDAIGSLPEHERSAVSLFYINGYSQAEVGEFLDVPAKTVKSRLHSARRKLRERMVGMVEHTLKKGAPGDTFVEETIEKIVGHAEELIGQRRLKEAEEVLRKGLAKAPDHAPALMLLNRSLMWDRVYNEDRWDLLPEIAENGRKILASGEDDEHAFRETARTLLAIPAMTEACDFITEWIARSGASLERLGMLAWAQGCIADYKSAERTWERFLGTSVAVDEKEVLEHYPLSCISLVDCLSAAGQTELAQRIARSAWQTFGRFAATVTRYPNFTWPSLFYKANLGNESAGIARDCLKALGSVGRSDSETQIVSFCLCSWVDDERAVLSDWLDWVRDNIPPRNSKDGAWLAREYCRAGNYGAMGRVAHATWEALRSSNETNSVEIDDAWWADLRFPAAFYIGLGDLETAGRLARQSVAEGHETSWCWLNDISILRGEPSPPELMADLAEREPDDPSLMYDSYHIAREAAAAGDEETAFRTLRRCLSLWHNPPLINLNAWERDTRWGGLRDHPEFRRLFAEKRRRIGPIEGSLWHFPGW